MFINGVKLPTKEAKFAYFWIQCYHPHWLRDALFPICGILIFFLSVLVNYGQFLFLFVRFCPFLFVSVCFWLFLSVFIGFCPFLSICFGSKSNYTLIKNIFNISINNFIYIKVLDHRYVCILMAHLGRNVYVTSCFHMISANFLGF